MWRCSQELGGCSRVVRTLGSFILFERNNNKKQKNIVFEKQCEVDRNFTLNKKKMVKILSLRNWPCLLIHFYVNFRHRLENRLKGNSKTDIFFYSSVRNLISQQSIQQSKQRRNNNKTCGTAYILLLCSVAGGGGACKKKK